jgi:hypothetical protein
VNEKEKEERGRERLIMGTSNSSIARSGVSINSHTSKRERGAKRGEEGAKGREGGNTMNPPNSITQNGVSMASHNAS